MRPFRHGVYTRQGGVSEAPWTSLNLGGTVGDSIEAVAENHRLLCQSLDLDRERAVQRVAGAWRGYGHRHGAARKPPLDEPRRWTGDESA